MTQKAPSDGEATALCTDHRRASGTNQCRRCGRPMEAPEEASLRKRAREFVVDAFTEIDGKPPTDEAVEKAVGMLCCAFGEEEPFAPFGPPTIIGALWEARLAILADEAGVSRQECLEGLLRATWGDRSP